ncbi:Golgi apyrase [Coemansia erecta]|nr:Golgi apyrase [Coemansia sp. RSA 2618]KAJ2815098.1 Golgi apyrase [Coemansia erecta]
MQCFKAAWLVNVLHSGFGVPREASPFQSVQQVGETEVSWTLGALLLRVSRQIHPQASPAVVPGIVLPKANASYYDDDDDYDHDHSGDRVDLADDSLWSPVHFAGLRKLLVLWALQPTFVRTLAVFIAILLCFLLVAALYWLLRHKLPHSFIKRSPMFPAPSSPSQLALAESHFTGGGSNEHYMMDVVASSPVGRRGESPEPDFPCDASLDAQSGSIEFRSRSAALANEEVSVSRSSSVSNLALLNRRRGGV